MNQKIKREKKKQSTPEIDQLFSKTYAGLGKGLVFIKKTKIKTWQGIFVIALVAGAALSVIFISAMNYYDSTHAALGQAKLSLVPVNGDDNNRLSIQKDGSFSLDVVLDALENEVVAIKADIKFDQNKFRLDSCSTADSPFGVNSNCTTSSDNPFQIVVDNRASGEIIITQAKTGHGVQNASGHIATLNFTALQTTTPSAPNITIFFNSEGQYDDSDVIVYGNDGNDILSEVGNATITVLPPTCSSFTYSDWGACQSNNTRSRSITSSSPSGCTGGSPITQESCVYVAPTNPCTSFTYSAWGDCQSNNTRSCSITSSSPSGCTGGSPITQESCVYVAPIITCTSFTGYSAWGACQPNGTQTRTYTTALPSGCTGGNPAISQTCTYIEPTNPCVSFTYSDWGACQSNKTQNRTVTVSSPSGCTGGNPVTSQSCEYVEPVDPGTTTDGTVDIGTIKIKDSDGTTSKKKITTGNKKITFKGKSSDPDLVGGKVAVFEGGSKKSEANVKSDGSWSVTVKANNDGTHEYPLQYFNSSGTKVGQSSTYSFYVDTEDPVITDLPLILNKRPGDILWWKATDNNKIDHYKYYFNGKTKETKKDSFIIPTNTPKGSHYLKVRAYDKAGNTDVKNILVRVR